MLLSVLRRHFQTPDPSEFSQLATHFFVYCGLELPDTNAISPLVVESLRQSISDKPDNPADPTSAHCRYTMVMDPTDSETAVDLLFTLKLLSRDNTDVITLSEFPEDAIPTRRTAVLADIKKAIENGRTLLLVNSGPLQSALYDVINRHYVVSVRDDGTAEAFANIALGSFSRYVKVHPEFRLIIHLPASERMSTPTPFLNRLEKYTLSVRDALAERICEVSFRPPVSLRSLPTPEQRQRLLNALQKGVDHFVSYTGGASSFYGMSGTETTSALILSALEDACISNNPDFELKRSVLGVAIAEAKLESLMNSRCQQQQQQEGQNDDNVDDVADNLPSYTETIGNTIPLLDTSTASLGSPQSSLATRLQNLIRVLNFKIMETARVETIFRLRKRLPAVYMTEYLDRQEHLSCVNILSVLLRHAAAASAPSGTGFESNISSFGDESFGQTSARLNETFPEGEKLVMYTRTDGHLLRIATDREYLRKFFTATPAIRSSASTSASATANATHTEGPSIHIVTTNEVNGLEGADMCVVPLSSFASSKTCKETLAACLRDVRPSVLLIVADMKPVRRKFFFLKTKSITTQYHRFFNLSRIDNIGNSVTGHLCTP
jgi:hypothetical protein